MSAFEKLRQLLHRDFDLPLEKLTREATLEDLEIDSLRMIEILFSIEDEFKITIPAEQAQIRERVKTLGDLAAYIDEIASAPGKAPA